MGGISREGKTVGKPAGLNATFSCRLQDSYGTVTPSCNQWRISRMPLKKPGYRWPVIIGTALLLGWAPGQRSSQRKTPTSLPNPPIIFRTRSGTSGTIVARLPKDPLQTIEHKFFLQCVIGHRHENPQKHDRRRIPRYQSRKPWPIG